MIFEQAIDPLEADNWLRTMEKKLGISHCEKQDNVPFPTHYLEGTATIWWDNAKVVWLVEEPLNWENFKTMFRKAHIPNGVLKLKTERIFGTHPRQHNSA